MRRLFVRLQLAVLLLVSFFSVATFVSPATAYAAACAAPSTDYGTVTSTITVSTAGTYDIWSRMAAPDSASNSYMLEVTNNGVTNCFTVAGNASGINTTGTDSSSNPTYFASGSQNWTKTAQGGATISMSLTASSTSPTTVKMIGTAANVYLDRIVMTTDTGVTGCVPTGKGDNCANPPDTTAPDIVTVTSPAAGTVTSPLTVAVDAHDDTAVTKVELYVDDVLRATDNASPWSFSGVTLTSGTHAIKAKAYDAASNGTFSNAVSVSVASAAQPVTITAPSLNAILSKDLNVSGFNGSAYVSTVTTSDASIVQVAFKLDGTTVATDSSSPYSATVNLSNLACGSHTIQTVATNSGGTTVGTTSASFVTTIGADINVDGGCHVTIGDLSMLAAKYGQNSGNLGRADINMDGKVGIADLSILATNYNK